MKECGGTRVLLQAVIIVTFCNPCRNVINPVALCDYKTKKKVDVVWNQLDSPLHFVIK